MIIPIFSSIFEENVPPNLATSFCIVATELVKRPADEIAYPLSGIFESYDGLKKVDETLIINKNKRERRSLSPKQSLD